MLIFSSPLSILLVLFSGIFYLLITGTKFLNVFECNLLLYNAKVMLFLLGYASMAFHCKMNIVNFNHNLPMVFVLLISDLVYFKLYVFR